MVIYDDGTYDICVIVGYLFRDHLGAYIGFHLDADSANYTYDYKSIGVFKLVKFSA